MEETIERQTITWEKILEICRFPSITRKKEKWKMVMISKSNNHQFLSIIIIIHPKYNKECAPNGRV